MDLNEVMSNKTNITRSFFENIIDKGKSAVNMFSEGMKQYAQETNDENAPPNNIEFPTNDPTSKLTELMTSSWLDPNSEDMQMLKNYTIEWLQGQVSWVGQSLQNSTWYTSASSDYSKWVTDYFQTISQMPWYAQIRKKYMSEVNNSDLDFAINQLAKSRDSAYSLVMAEAYKRWDVVNPYNIQMQADKLSTMYNNQINSMIEAKNNRLSEAKDLASLDYEDRMNRVKLWSDMLDRLRGMKEDAYNQVRDGVADAKWLSEIDNTIKRSEREYKTRLYELWQSTWINQAELLFKMKDYTEKYGETLDPMQKQYYHNQYVYNQTQMTSAVLNWKENWASVVATLQNSSRWFNQYEDLWWIVAVNDSNWVNEILWKQWWSVSWRTNNPGNITRSGSTETAKRLWAVWVYKNHNNLRKDGTPRSYLIFKSPEDWTKAMAKLILYWKSYSWKTLEDRLRIWQWWSSSAISILSKSNPTLLKKTWWYTEAEQQLIADTITNSESWKTGTALDVWTNKDYFTEQTNQITSQVQQYKDKWYSRSETNQLLKQQYWSDMDATVAEVIGKVYEWKAWTESFEEFMSKAITPWSYQTVSGAVQYDKLINDIIKNKFVDTTNASDDNDILKQAWNKIIANKVTNVDNAQQVLTQSLTLFPNYDDFYIWAMKKTGMSDEDIFQTYTWIWDTFVWEITSAKDQPEDIQGAWELLKKLKEQWIWDAKQWKEWLKEKYWDWYRIAWFWQDVWEAIYKEAF